VAFIIYTLPVHVKHLLVSGKRADSTGVKLGVVSTVWQALTTTMIIIDQKTQIPFDEIEFSAIRASGPGGQNVNKVSSAIHLRFDIEASSLPDQYKQQLKALKDRRISKEGIIVIKAQRYRNQEKNRQEALERLVSLILKAVERKPKRIPTRPGAGARKRRLDAKSRRSQVKVLRGKVKSIE
jgi:ribosome-associated protein